MLRVAAFVSDFFSQRHIFSSRCSVPMTADEFGEFGDGVECDQCGAMRYPERDVTGMLRSVCPNGCGCD